MAFLESELHKKYNNNYVLDPASGDFVKFSSNPEEASGKVWMNGTEVPINKLSFRNLVFDNVVMVNYEAVKSVLVQVKLAPRASPKGLAVDSYCFIHFYDYILQTGRNAGMDWRKHLSADLYKYPPRITNYYLNLWSSFAIAPQIVVSNGVRRGKDSHLSLGARQRDVYFLQFRLGVYDFMSNRWVSLNPWARKSETIMNQLRDGGLSTC